MTCHIVIRSRAQVLCAAIYTANAYIYISTRSSRHNPRAAGLLHFWDNHHAPQNVHCVTSRSGAFFVRLISRMAQTSVY